MATILKKYRKKPVEIVAVQFTGGADNGKAISFWVTASGSSCSWFEEVEEVRVSNGEISQSHVSENLRIKTLEGVMRADVGDWIIQGVIGEFYPCKPKVFEATYVEV